MLLVLFTAGLGFICATVQVYNTDFKNLLPYLLRLGLYMTPILWVADGSSGIKEKLATYNPLAPIFELWSDAIVNGQVGPARHLAARSGLQRGALRRRLRRVRLQGARLCGPHLTRHRTRRPTSPS